MNCIIASNTGALGLNLGLFMSFSSKVAEFIDCVE